jgi:hypothetical protein
LIQTTIFNISSFSSYKNGFSCILTADPNEPIGKVGPEAFHHGFRVFPKNLDLAVGFPACPADKVGHASQDQYPFPVPPSDVSDCSRFLVGGHGAVFCP